ncbi:FAD-dependent oxidoreductase [Synechococcus sp. CCY9201]|uniref:glycerol-3-phosphate dehydrogenase/oxidase n=1 Tax=Synechococcus sp. CCY9201 TaxID=174697 RepID=UPI002B21809F|nr:FAD-dependent oxidoreductase [Synechococcus sp. CCY9201]MEA5473402.1 FAD-dependent oxidoreductase [Synechococcus sp. CCY9201]
MPSDRPPIDPDASSLTGPYDLLVIGAGATGATLALEAVRRGLSVALVDARDIASGTSSRSTKLLHGGVRYLELAFRTLDRRQLRLVREALAERGHWLKAVPFLAHRLELLLPTRQPLAQAYYAIGLGLYDLLAGRESIGASRCAQAKEVQRLLPDLAPDHSGVLYSDGQFDDARLNLLIARTAARHGALVRPHTPVVELLQKNGRLCGAVLEATDGQRSQVEARVVVNAAGIGADAVRRLAAPDLPSRLQVSRGMHLVLEQALCPAGTGLLVPSTDDGRVLFMLPFFGRTLVGTTDTACPAAAAEQPSPEGEAYLLDYVRRWFPSVQSPQVSSRWAGGRPLLLPDEAATSTAGVVREHSVERLPCGLVSVLGGKWTTCRTMALEALAAVTAELGQTLPAPKAAPIVGSATAAAQTTTGLAALRQRLTETLQEQLGPAGAAGLSAHLLASHGLEAEAVLACASHAAEREPLSSVIPLTAAEVRHMARHEWVRDPEDVLARRCRLAFVDTAEAERLKEPVRQLLDEEGVHAGS